MNGGRVYDTTYNLDFERTVYSHLEEIMECIKVYYLSLTTGNVLNAKIKRDTVCTLIAGNT